MGGGQNQNQNQNQNQGQDDKLTTKEKEQIEAKLGISADLAGDAHGNDAYLLLQVPDFGEPSFPNTETTEGALFDSQTFQPTRGETARKLQSYLRLGAFDYSSESPAAKQLLQWIPQANAASDPSRDDKAVVPGMAGAEGVVFVDDYRTRMQDVTSLTTAVSAGEGVDPDHGLTRDERLAETLKLYTRGGWRDHSDGNRISTTWGDKVEVVRGNYKMFVMGRQDNAEQAMGWEATGGHIQDFAPGTMPGASFFLEWIDDSRYHAGTQKGVWLLCNTTENVYEYARTAGNLREEVWGDVHESYVGSANPSGVYGDNAATSPIGTMGHEPPHELEDGRSYHRPRSTTKDTNSDGRATPPWGVDNDGMVRTNPHIIEKVWAERIDSWAGSPEWFIPHIDEKKYANTVNEFTQVSGTITGDTLAGAINEREAVGAKAATSISSSIAETSVTGFVLTTGAVLGLEIETKYNLGSLTTNLVLGSAVELTLAKETIAAELVGSVLESSVFAAKIEVSFGLTVGFKGGATEEFVWGEHNETDMPKKKNTSLAREDMTVDEKHQAINMSDTTVQKEIKALQAKINGAKVDVGPGG